LDQGSSTKPDGRLSLQLCTLDLRSIENGVRHKQFYSTSHAQLLWYFVIELRALHWVSVNIFVHFSPQLCRQPEKVTAGVLEGAYRAT